MPPRVLASGPKPCGGKYNCLRSGHTVSWEASKILRTSANTPFYSCVLSYLAMNASETGGDLALIQTSQLFSCKCQLVSITTT